MYKVKSIVVFCASSLGQSDCYEKQATYVGHIFAQRGIRLVYGGGRVGLMGAVANGALSKGGEVIGVIPQFLNSKEREHTGVTKLITVDTMHDRKRIMHDYSDAVVALPGGFGTLEELFEMITWGQLGLHNKPVGLLNINGFYDHLIQFIEHMVNEGLLKPENQRMLLVAETIEDLLDKMERYEAPQMTKWIQKDEI
ncbi:TIGR00730 family Rossman fold protein [Sphingobacterium sp. SYP-B4668]|uniref:LOG family protein n=1 Tax=Sphingobacterium sp. SYP-B4668 TaxID=2996035 RepID=UPI0022DE1841|nr:TIGR00730 family Rossman fold protein [Sphingobacterium sp. SYP-B4668]